ncbi:MAG: hypothetical protein NXI24_06755 [bacterium]|nr:hypothetical protein [bacterium]
MSARILHRMLVGAALGFALVALQYFATFAVGPAETFALLGYLAESEHGPWTPYLYQYGVGGFFFFLAIIVAGYKGVFELSHPSDRRMVLFLVLGFVFYASLHGGWILLLEAGR